MSESKKDLSRRDFIKSASVTGITSLIALSGGISGSVFAREKGPKVPKTEKPPQIEFPKRVFGKSGLKLPILSQGGIVDYTSNLVLLKKTLDWGITYWDTANSYNGGNSELGIGMFFEKFPEERKKIFLVTKGGARTPAKLEQKLNLSLERMKTDYIDLYFVHGIKDISEMTPEIKAWAEKAKKAGKIKLMGFSTHKNMANILSAAPKLGWIDGIMMTYNYRIMNKDNMKKAVEECHKAGIGLTAMKTQAGRSSKKESEADLILTEAFTTGGYSLHQAKLKAVWKNEMITSICSQMPNLTILKSNIDAALSKKKILKSELNSLQIHSEKTCTEYCAGCSEICQKAMGQDFKIAEVMRYMMYCNSYGDVMRAKEKFAKIPFGIKNKLAYMDFSTAEKACPQNIEIGRIMKEAVKTLG
jgi:uncharacterized protein